MAKAAAAEPQEKVRAIMARLKDLADPMVVEGMNRSGIRGERALGIPVPALRQIAKETGRDHDLAIALWETEIHEARLLAAFVGEPDRVTEDQMEKWAADFDSWDVCDQMCGNVFIRTPFAYDKAVEWSGRPEVFVKRAGFALMAYLAIHDKKAADSKFVPFLRLIVRASEDDRNFVKKAVNWALRQIGKRSLDLNEKAVATAEEIRQLGNKSGRWIASSALRELTGEKVQSRLTG